MPKPRKYERPDFLPSEITQDIYEKWLRRRAKDHVKRDRRRGNTTATIAAYKIAIHRAVGHSGRQDQYTGETLNWALVGQYSDVEAKAGGRCYKAKFALLPSIDHVGDGLAGVYCEQVPW
jgi:hypothetical protein